MAKVFAAQKTASNHSREMRGIIEKAKSILQMIANSAIPGHVSNTLQILKYYFDYINRSSNYN